MLAVQIKDIKNFMKLLLISDTFDGFEMIRAVISAANTFDIDGHVDSSFFGEDYESSEYFGHEYTPWKLIKNLCFEMIKGKHTPLSFKFILRADPETASSILAESSSGQPDPAATSLILTVRYDEHGLMLTSATSSYSFTTDKTADGLWDKWVSVFTQDMQ